MRTTRTRQAGVLLGLFLAAAALIQAAPSGKELTFAEVMKFRQIFDPVLSPDGNWAAFSLQPDRGDGQGYVRRTTGESLITIERGAKPVFSKDSAWAAFQVKPKALDMEKSGKDKPKPGMSLVRLSDGTAVQVDNVDRFSFSENSLWVAWLVVPDEPKAGEGKEETKKEPAREKGKTLVLRKLTSGEEIRVPQVLSFAFDQNGEFLAYDRLGPEAKDNGLFVRRLKLEALPEEPVSVQPGTRYSNLAWSEKGAVLAYVAGPLGDKDAVGPGSLNVWEARTGKHRAGLERSAVPGGWGIPEKNKLVWSKDGRRLFIGLKSLEFFDVEGQKKSEEPLREEDIFDTDKILSKREVDVWHWNDPLIVSHQKKGWMQFKDRLYTAVFHLDKGRLVPLAARDLPQVEPVENPDLALGQSDTPYLKDRTWDGEYFDLYVVSLSDGSRKKIASRLASDYGSRASLSPGGRYAVYYDRGDWHLYDCRLGRVRNLTGPTGVPFGDEDNDVPGAPRGYGLAGWLEDDAAVLVNDKYDVWSFPTAGGIPSPLTAGQGRSSGRIFRVLRTDPEARFFKDGQDLLLSMFHEREKYHGFYSARLGRPGTARLLEGRKKFVFKGKAEKADVVLYTREAFDEFPDLWATDSLFRDGRRISEANPQIADFAWGSAELVEWSSLDGLPLQGVLIKPPGYEPGRRYPVLVYFYEIMSDRLYEYNQTVVNHRPCFPVYAGRGYCLFLPDVRYEVGRPGLSAFKCVVPGLNKLVDMGLADPKALALHGHSWGGYETAFLVTQTDMFACAIAGAAVANMTSAYSGIRWESGVARQMQYEKEQSRIGGSLWERPELFWANSPVFFADRIKTPLLLMHGDEDGAVPWYQSIELYLAMRRLGKECVFLQYRGEPHHPQKYANKLDYSIRMMEYLDHYLRGKPAPAWMTEGLPYRGR